VERPRKTKRTITSRPGDTNFSTGAITEDDEQGSGGHKPKSHLARKDCSSRCHRWYDDPNNYGWPGPYFMRLTLQLTFAFIICAYALYIYRAYETTVHPVISEFNVTSIDRVDRRIEMSGSMVKQRSCTFLRTIIYGSREDTPSVLLDYQFMDSEGYSSSVKSRSTGYQTWGPWAIFLPEDFENGSIQVYASHKCWPFWNTETNLTKVPIPKHSSE